MTDQHWALPAIWCNNVSATGDAMGNVRLVFAEGLPGEDPNLARERCAVVVCAEVVKGLAELLEKMQGMQEAKRAAAAGAMQ